MNRNINYIKVTIPKSDSGIRIKKYILTHYRSEIQSKESLHRAFARNEICVNGRAVEETRMLKEEDVLEIKFDKSVDENKKIQSVPIRVCYQDQYLAIVWKPSGQNFPIFVKAIQEKVGIKDILEEKAKIWCINDIQKAASGLILVAKTEEINTKLTEMYNNHEISFKMRILCHGLVPTTDMKLLFTPETNKKDEESEPIIPTKIIKSIHILSQTRSNSSQYITTLDLNLFISSNNPIRRLFYFHSNHPIIGNSNFTKILRANKDKGLCASLLGISFHHPIINESIDIQENEPEKFNVMREREAKFWKRKMEQEEEEISKATAEGDTIDLTEKREDGQLLAYLLGQKDFCDLTFKITPDCLIPRTSSETLVNAATDYLLRCQSDDGDSKKVRRVIDVGTGCGNLLISILSKVKENVLGVGIDISPTALDIAKTNAITHQVINRTEWKIQDMTTLSSNDDDNTKYDILICNPPYLDLHKIRKKKPQMACLSQEPKQALFAKEAGYEWYNVLSRVAPLIVENDGRVILECGKGMMDCVLNIWSDWEPETVIKDVQRWDRCVVLKKKKMEIVE